MLKGKVVIIEDEFFAAQHLSDLVISFGFSVVGVYHSGERFLEETDWQFDVAILDIFLSEKVTGLDLAIHLNKKQKPYIFLTANQDSQTLKEAAMLFPASYLSKPFNSNDVKVALEIILYKMEPTIQIRTSKGIQEINPSEIFFIKSDGVYIEIYTKNEKIVQRKLLKEIEIDLPNSFVRVHRSYLVNKNHISSKSASHVVVNDYELPISRKFRGIVE